METADVIFEWRLHPIADFPRKRWLFIGAVSACLVAVWFSFHEWAWVLFSLLFLVLALNAFVFPTTFRVTATELEIRRGGITKRRPLTDFNRVEIGPNGIFLSPFSEPSRLDNHRGVFLFHPPDKAGLGDFLKAHCLKPDSGSGK